MAKSTLSTLASNLLGGGKKTTTSNRPKTQTGQAAKNTAAMYNSGQGSGRNSSYTATYRPDVLDAVTAAKAAGYTDANYGGALAYTTSGNRSGGSAAAPKSPGGGSSGGGRSGGGGGRGGGGGGGGGGAAAAAQAQIDAMAKMLASGMFTVNPATYDAQRKTITDATAADQAAATTAYNNLDTWLQANQTNPYANVQVRQAAVAPSYNPYLASQGIEGSAPVATNPNDGGYAAFQNVLSLLGANQLANNASGLRQSQEARTFSGQQIGGMDNAFLAQVANQQAQAQQALDAEKRAQVLQLLPLLGTPGVKAPDLSALGITL